LKEQIIEIFKYGISGTITTIINLFLLKVFIDFRIYYLLANIVSYTISVIVNYILNQRYVFSKSARGNTAKVKKQFLKFLISRLILTIIMILVTFVLNKWFIFINK